jgi:hypothetical protein
VLQSNTTGTSNTALGALALFSNQTGSGNTAVGTDALHNNTASGNTAVGSSALQDNQTGGSNTAVGTSALASNTIGTSNTAVGYSALDSNITGDVNTAVGNTALQSNTTGTSNTALGVNSLFNNTTGNNNTAVGTTALFNTTTGVSNIALGIAAGANLTSGNNNIYLGHPGEPTESQTIRLGEPGVHTRTFLAGAIYVNGVLQTSASDAQLKTNVTPLTHVLEKLEQLRGVSFEWNDVAASLTGHTPGQRDIGVIAQEVEAVFPELVTTWGEDGYKAVAYDKLTGVLIAAVKELQAETATQQQHIAALEARLAALEQYAAAHRGPRFQLLSASLSAGGPLFGGLVLLGLVLGRRRYGSQRRG